MDVPQGNDSWCKGTIFQNDAQTFLQVLGSLFVGAYGFLNKISKHCFSQVCMYGSGVIADYFNPRYYLTWGSFMGSFFMLVLGLGNLWKINSIEFFIMALSLFGAAQSTAWPVLLTSATHWYDGKRSGFFFALWNTHFYVESELPPWLDTKRAIEFYEAFKVPGVLEFSACMFFSRMVSYFFLFWQPAFLLEFGMKTLNQAALYSLPYIIGGFLGGVTIGILKDIFQKNALICISFSLLSIPAIALQVFQQFQAVSGRTHSYA
ncbi:unnamed protein product [Larinioides sclopetarius]|uniref:Major facilitator superfamily protein n=1 Tax=Larinioides sclopetarius TaxID=280406 RepID=A0AAV2AYW7_9ARAC